MSEQDKKFEQYMVKVMGRALPGQPMARVRTLAKELAEGAIENVWETGINLFRGDVTTPAIRTYLSRRWKNNYPNLPLLISNHYLEVGPVKDTLLITREAFDLLNEVETASIFISYKRSESSAFALLVLARLKMAGLEPFLDLSLIPGEDWQAGLKERIQKYDYFIALLGQETLNSEVCLQEIAWAIEARLHIIPIWHNGFAYRSDRWRLHPALDRVLTSTHTIRVVEESALAYNNALVELLNRFGVTP